MSARTGRLLLAAGLALAPALAARAGPRRAPRRGRRRWLARRRRRGLTAHLARRAIERLQLEQLGLGATPARAPARAIPPRRTPSAATRAPEPARERRRRLLPGLPRLPGLRLGRRLGRRLVLPGLRRLLVAVRVLRLVRRRLRRPLRQLRLRRRRLLRSASPQGASLRVLVDPAEARVYVDGYYAGVVDDFDGLLQRLHVAPGRHEITLKLEGYKAHRMRVYVGPDATLKLHHEMQKGAGETFEDLTGGAPPPEREVRRERDDREDDRPLGRCCAAGASRHPSREAPAQRAAGGRLGLRRRSVPRNRPRGRSRCGSRPGGTGSKWCGPASARRRPRSTSRRARPRASR